MKAIRLEEPRKFTQIDLDEPPPPGPGEALVRVHHVGICGTDISGYLGKMPFFSYPRIPGHELGVEVLEVGANVTAVAPGDRCSVEPYLNCSSCIACRRGKSNCCEKLEVLGVHTDGGLRGRLVVPASKLHASTALSSEQLALVETLGIGCHAVDRAGVESGEHVLVIGAGPIGLAVMEFAKIAGARVTVFDLRADRLDFCLSTMGVDHAVQVAGDGAELAALEEITEGSLATAVFDATGSRASMGAAAQYVAHTGRLVFVGIVPESISLSDPLLHRRELTVFASRNSLPADFRRIIELIEAGRLDTGPWITHRTRLDDLIANFPSYTRAETGVIKAMVEVED